MYTEKITVYELLRGIWQVPPDLLQQSVPVPTPSVQSHSGCEASAFSFVSWLQQIEDNEDEETTNTFKLKDLDDILNEVLDSKNDQLLMVIQMKCCDREWRDETVNDPNVSNELLEHIHKQSDRNKDKTDKKENTSQQNANCSVAIEKAIVDISESAIDDNKNKKKIVATIESKEKGTKVIKIDGSSSEELEPQKTTIRRNEPQPTLSKKRKLGLPFFVFVFFLIQ
ncbi:hypothetical protein RFI_04615 [Reticulomyxa filosa]|uniref:Uncharacterized protein n=1 Tax=Reticulomyxa filosa TaxID=46433 RepID=X6P342_RETFI|nr:hypothetical protein RFI_04615 [Reticulomyxa filosa]|eukprot:ETO32499.1 hypothetical protein RFI_04615 [Reticulomyxa filosa]